MAGADEFSKAQQQQAGAYRKGRKREPKMYHSPWDTPPIHCLELVNGRSNVDEMEWPKFWKFISAESSVLKWRTECHVFAL